LPVPVFLLHAGLFRLVVAASVRLPGDPEIPRRGRGGFRDAGGGGIAGQVAVQTQPKHAPPLRRLWGGGVKIGEGGRGCSIFFHFRLQLGQLLLDPAVLPLEAVVFRMKFKGVHGFAVVQVGCFEFK